MDGRLGRMSHMSVWFNQSVLTIYEPSVRFENLDIRTRPVQKIGTFGFFIDFPGHDLSKKLGLGDHFWTLNSPNFRQGSVSTKKFRAYTAKSDNNRLGFME